MSTPNYYLFDIETRPVPEAVAKYTKPFPDFDVSAVKCGNMKDPDKIAEKKAQAQADHELARLDYWKKAYDNAALDPFTGAIVCIGIASDTGPVEILDEKTEAGTLRQFWQLFELAENAVTKWVFWSGSGDPSRKFDIDFIVTRSRINRVPIPVGVRSGRFYGGRIVDLAGEFLLHQRERYLSLTKACDMLGVYEEHKDVVPKDENAVVTGETFWRWWDGVMDIKGVAGWEQRNLARAYLTNDVNSLRHLAAVLM